MKKSIITGALALIMSVCFTSCLDDKNENEAKATFIYDDAFNIVENAGTGENSLQEMGAYTFQIDYVNQTIKLGINDLRLGDRMAAQTMVTEEIPYVLTENSIKASKQDVMAKAGTGATRMLDYVNMEIIDRYINNVYMPVVRVGMSLDDGQYVVNAMPKTGRYMATLTSQLSMAQGNPFTKSDVRVDVVIDPLTATAAMHLTGVQFAAQMPGFNMTFPGIAVKPHGSSYDLECASLIPEISGDKYTSFPITNLSGYCSATTDNYRVAFTCTPANMGAAFAVTMSLTGNFNE